jgi:peptidoglycan/xylan/chitin deacetylase (PgdA/CDA1 family)
MYHHIGPLREGFDPSLTVSPRMFERHLRWLSRHGYTPIRSADWIRFQLEGARVPEKPVLLTFDDGYADTAEFGLALLRKYGFTGTVFVVTDQIDGINAWDLHLGLSAQPLMTTEQIRYWASRGIEFGSHTRTHPDLRACTREQIVTELRGSRERLEGVTGDPVSVLAYPYGYFDESVADSARQFFAAALTCQQGVNHVTTDMMHLRRAEVVPKYAWFDIRFFVRFGRNPVRGFISRLRSIYRYFFPRTTSWSIGSTRN